MTEEIPSKKATIVVLLFMGITGFVALMVLMAPHASREERPQGGVFQDTRAGQQIQTQVMQKRRERVDRTDSVEMARTVGGSPAVPPAGGFTRMNPKRAKTTENPRHDEGESVLKYTFRGWSDKKAAELGQKKGLLSKLAERMVKHPKVVKALFDNKLLVAAFMGRDTVKRNCSSPKALDDLLTGSSSAGMRSEKLDLVKTFLSNPSSAKAFAGSRMAKAVMGCSSVKAMAQDTGNFGRIVAANPGYMQLMQNPVLTQALTENPAAKSLYDKGSGSLGF